MGLSIWLKRFVECVPTMSEVLLLQKEFRPVLFKTADIALLCKSEDSYQQIHNNKEVWIETSYRQPMEFELTKVYNVEDD